MSWKEPRSWSLTCDFLHLACTQQVRFKGHKRRVAFNHKKYHMIRILVHLAQHTDSNSGQLHGQQWQKLMLEWGSIEPWRALQARWHIIAI